MEWIVLSLIVVAVAGLIVIGLRRRRTNRDRLSAIPGIGRMANAAVDCGGTSPGERPSRRSRNRRPLARTRASLQPRGRPWTSS